MASSCERRILRDISKVSSDAALQNLGIEVLPSDNLKVLEVVVGGPDDTPYETGRFKLETTFPDRYPYEPPSVRFITRVMHPNVSKESGVICVDTLKDKWRPVMGLSHIILTAIELLRAPNPDSPLNISAAMMMQSDSDLFTRTVSVWTFAFADGNKADPELLQRALQLVESGAARDLEESVTHLTRARWCPNVAANNLLARNRLLEDSDEEFPDIPLGA